MKSHSFFIFITEPYSVKEFQLFNRKNTKSFIQIFFKRKFNFYKSMYLYLRSKTLCHESWTFPFTIITSLINAFESDSFLQTVL